MSRPPKTREKTMPRGLRTAARQVRRFGQALASTEAERAKRQAHRSAAKAGQQRSPACWTKSTENRGPSESDHGPSTSKQRAAPSVTKKPEISDRGINSRHRGWREHS